MFVIPVLPEAIIEENETNEIIHDFEDDNEGNQFISSSLRKKRTQRDDESDNVNRFIIFLIGIY